MIRGTSHTFRFDCSDLIDNITDIKSIYVIFDQTNNKDTPIIKTFEISFNDDDPPVAIISGDSGCSIILKTKEVVVDLTPEETIKFTEDKQLMVQLKGERYDSTVFADYIQYFTVYPMLEPIAANEDISGCQCKELPVASTSTLGGVKIGNGVIIQDGVISTKTYNVATTTNAGLLSASDKRKLDALSADGSPYTTICYSADNEGINITTTPQSGEIRLSNVVTRTVTNSVSDRSSSLVTEQAVYDYVSPVFGKTAFNITDNATTVDVSKFDYFVLVNNYETGTQYVTLDNVDKKSTTISAAGSYKSRLDTSYSEYDYYVIFTKSDAGYTVEVKYKFNNGSWELPQYTDIYGYKRF